MALQLALDCATAPEPPALQVIVTEPVKPPVVLVTEAV
jgi:hypothetical protein